MYAHTIAIEESLVTLLDDLLDVGLQAGESVIYRSSVIVFESERLAG